MEIRLEDVEKVMELAGVDYYTAKEALVKAEGNLDKALEDLAPTGTSVGDEVKDLIGALAKDGVTVLMTSHLLGDTEDVCTKIAILSHGRVAACGRTTDLLTRTQDARFTIEGLSEAEAKSLADIAERTRVKVF